MTEIRFYHIQKKSAEATVFDLAERALARGHKILIRLQDEDEAKRLNDFLWINKPDSFLPHGMDKPESQPIFLTATNDNPNNSDVLFLMPGCETGGVGDFALVCDILDGRDGEQVAAGRTRYRDWKAQGHELSYWQQSDTGKWEQKS
jgi:DNA polymerase-3 subunit chi